MNSELDAVAKRFSDDDSAGRWSDLYDSPTVVLEDENFRVRRDITVRHVERLLRPGGKVLDLGCGAAPVLAELRRRGIPCTGLDYAEDMLKNARRRLQAMGLDTSDIHQGDCRFTPFDDATFDVVVCLGVMSYVENHDELIREIRRLLRPGGHAIVSFRNRYNPILWDPVVMAKHCVKKVLGRPRHAGFEPGGFLDARQVRREMQSFGFAEEQFVGIGFGPLRVNYREVLSERAAIRWSRGLGSGLERLGVRWPLVWLADVSLWIYRRDEAR